GAGMVCRQRLVAGAKVSAGLFARVECGRTPLAPHASSRHPQPQLQEHRRDLGLIGTNIPQHSEATATNSRLLAPFSVITCPFIYVRSCSTAVGIRVLISRVATPIEIPGKLVRIIVLAVETPTICGTRTRNDRSWTGIYREQLASVVALNAKLPLHTHQFIHQLWVGQFASFYPTILSACTAARQQE